jgi:hypothetical protein
VKTIVCPGCRLRNPAAAASFKILVMPPIAFCVAVAG